MISRSGDPNRQPRRILWVALLLSLLLHPFLIVLLGLHFDRVEPLDPTKRTREPVETITISTVPKRMPQAVAASPSRPKRPIGRPRPSVVPAPVVAASHHPQRLAQIVPRPIERTIVVPPYRPPVVPKRTPPTTRTLALAPTAPRAKPLGRAASIRYSPSQIAQIENDLAKSVHASRESQPLDDVPRQVAAVAPKHYGIDYQAFDGNLRSARGVCDPIKDWQADGWDYYYAACNVEEPDGSMQRKAMPWPVRWRPSDDPWSGMNGRPTGPMPLPPPGWRPDPDHPVDPDYLAYLRHNGYPI